MADEEIAVGTFRLHRKAEDGPIYALVSVEADADQWTRRGFNGKDPFDAIKRGRDRAVEDTYPDKPGRKPRGCKALLRLIGGGA